MARAKKRSAIHWAGLKLSSRQCSFRHAGLLKILKACRTCAAKLPSRAPPELIGSLPDRGMDTCRHQRLRLRPETSHKSPRNDLLTARSRWHDVAHEVVQDLWRFRDCLVRAGQCRIGARRSQRPLAGAGWRPRASGTLRRRTGQTVVAARAEQRAVQNASNNSHIGAINPSDQGTR